jgi:hypothetical protein
VSSGLVFEGENALSGMRFLILARTDAEAQVPCENQAWFEIKP